MASRSRISGCLRGLVPGAENSSQRLKGCILDIHSGDYMVYMVEFRHCEGSETDLPRYFLNHGFGKD